MRRIRMFFKLAGAGITAFAVLCALFFPYYTMPGRVPNAHGNTNFVWEAGSFWMQAEEGISWGRADEWGFNNPSVIEDPDILLLGSSHMEAVNVQPGESAAAQLSGLFAGEYSVYSMGMSGHDLPEVCHYLPETLAIFAESPKYIVIETRSLSLSENELDFILTAPAAASKGRPASLKALRDLPFLSVLARQMDTGLIDLLLPGLSASADAGADMPDAQLYDRLMAHLAAIEAESGAQILFVYHRPGTFSPEGAFTWSENPYQAAFSAACGEHGIGFIDLAPDFATLWADESLVPYGFITGSPNSGHLNAHGHRTAAEAICRTIREMEG